MKARAKNNNKFCSTWVIGDYITEPPIRPMDGAKRSLGHYIDEGGYPGANVCEINIETLCMYTGIVDCIKNEIFENDILLYETEQETGYFIILDTETAVDIINGEILYIKELRQQDINVIGNIIDFPDFVDGIRHCVDTGEEIPYIPVLDVMSTSFPFFKLICSKCGHLTLRCCYTAIHEKCGGYFKIDFATKVYKKREQKEKVFA